MAAVGYACVVTLAGAPVALLAGLFVPLSFGTESLLRAAQPATESRRVDALLAGFGVVVGAVGTVVLVFVAGAMGH